MSDQLARDFFAAAELVRVAIDLAREQQSEPEHELERASQLIEQARGIVRQRANFRELTTQASDLRGPKGDTGDTGPQGLKGDTGDQGPAGTNGTNGEGLVSGSILYLASAVTPPSGYTLIGSDRIRKGGAKSRPVYLTVDIYLKN